MILYLAPVEFHRQGREAASPVHGGKRDIFLLRRLRCLCFPQDYDASVVIFPVLHCGIVSAVFQNTHTFHKIPVDIAVRPGKQFFQGLSEAVLMDGKIVPVDISVVVKQEIMLFHCPC